jgi:hypothetical protein
MDIYFCDLCSARVTDVDLRSGQGIRKQQDVICGTCLEVGHGSDWLNQHAGDKDKKPAVAAARSSSGKVKTPLPNPAVALINSARDRARTRERTKTDTDDGLGESFLPPGHEDAIPEFEEIEEVDHVVTARVADAESDTDDNLALASAANAFSALSSHPKSNKGDADLDDLPDKAELTPSRANSPSTAADSPSSRDSKQGPNDEKNKGSGKASGRTDPPTGAHKNRGGSARRPASAAPSAKTSSSAIRKAAGARKRAPSASSVNIIIISLISLSLITFGFTYAYKKNFFKEPKEAQTKTFNLSQETISKVKQSRDLAVAALRSKDVEQMEQAKQEIDNCRAAIYAFEDEAKKQGMEQGDIDRAIERSIKWQETQMLIRSLNDEIQVQKQK